MVDIRSQVHCHADHCLHLMIILITMMASDEAGGCWAARDC